MRRVHRSPFGALFGVSQDQTGFQLNIFVTLFRNDHMTTSANSHLFAILSMQCVDSFIIHRSVERFNSLCLFSMAQDFFSSIAMAWWINKLSIPNLEVSFWQLLGVDFENHFQKKCSIWRNHSTNHHHHTHLVVVVAGPLPSLSSCLVHFSCR